MLKKFFFRGMYSPDFESEEELSANSHSNSSNEHDDEDGAQNFRNAPDFLEFDEAREEKGEVGGRGSSDFMGVPEERGGRGKLTRQNTFTVEEGDEYIPPANRTRPVTASKR